VAGCAARDFSLPLFVATQHTEDVAGRAPSPVDAPFMPDRSLRERMRILQRTK
jgi:hypothetical protein